MCFNTIGCNPPNSPMMWRDITAQNPRSNIYRPPGLLGKINLFQDYFDPSVSYLNYIELITKHVGNTFNIKPIVYNMKYISYTNYGQEQNKYILTMAFKFMESMINGFCDEAVTDLLL